MDTRKNPVMAGTNGRAVDVWGVASYNLVPVWETPLMVDMEMIR